MKTAAFFDLDKTLLTVNSGWLWALRERRVGRIGSWMFAKAAGYMVLYQLGVLPMARVLREALATVRGVPESEIRRWTEEWFFTEVIPHEAPMARTYIEAHRARGHRLVLLTSSSPYASECALQFFGLEASLSMRYEVVDGHMTGDFIPPLCYGEGKVELAEAFAAQHGIRLSRSYFYTDSVSDVPMLQRVGHPRVVEPDLRLTREAGRQGWPVLRWRISGGGPLYLDE